MPGLVHRVCTEMMLTFVCLGCLLVGADTATKTWKFNNEILDPQNWEGGKPLSNCNGVIFPENLGSVGTVLELFTDKLVLPTNGELEILDGGFIQLTGSPFTCIRIKELEHKYWLSPDSWKYEENAAIPDVEKVPCLHDDVVFSSQATVAVFYPETTASVNSIQMMGVKFSDQQWQNFLQSEYGGEQFNTVEFEQSSININPRECNSRSGCTCHDSDEFLYWVCSHAQNREAAPCFDPVTPNGHCSPICGGIVLMEVSKDFDLNSFQNQIPKYDKVDTYASKIIKRGESFVQVAFVEKEEYAELSTNAASDFHRLVSKDLKNFKLNGASLEVSGIRLPKGSPVVRAFSIILGTFAAVCFMFLCIYVIYVGPLKDYDFRSRLPITQFSFGNLRPFFFAKFENKEEGQMSMAASMVSLERSFDNPMYGSHRPSTSSAVLDVVIESETESAGKSEMIHENPAFDDMKCDQVEIEDAEE